MTDTEKQLTSDDKEITPKAMTRTEKRLNFGDREIILIGTFLRMNLAVTDHVRNGFQDPGRILFFVFDLGDLIKEAGTAARMACGACLLYLVKESVLVAVDPALYYLLQMA